MLVWVYYSAQIVLFGAEFTQVYANELGSRIVPTENAVPADEPRPDACAQHRHSQIAAGIRSASTGCLSSASACRAPWWGTVLLLWVAVTRFPRRSGKTMNRDRDGMEELPDCVERLR